MDPLNALFQLWPPRSFTPSGSALAPFLQWGENNLSSREMSPLFLYSWSNSGGFQVLSCQNVGDNLLHEFIPSCRCLLTRFRRGWSLDLGSWVLGLGSCRPLWRQATWAFLHWGFFLLLSYYSHTWPAGNSVHEPETLNCLGLAASLGSNGGWVFPCVNPWRVCVGITSPPHLLSLSVQFTLSNPQPRKRCIYSNLMWTSGSQTVVPGPTASISPGNWLEGKLSSPDPALLNLKLLESGLVIFVVINRFWCETEWEAVIYTLSSLSSP